MKGDAGLSPRRSWGYTGQTRLLPAPSQPGAPPALASLAKSVLGSHLAENGVFPLMKHWVICQSAWAPFSRGGCPPPGVSYPPIEQFPPRTAAKSLGCKGITEGCDPPSWGSARQRLPDRPVAESQGNRLALKNQQVWHRWRLGGGLLAVGIQSP